MRKWLAAVIAGIYLIVCLCSFFDLCATGEYLCAGLSIVGLGVLGLAGAIVVEAIFFFGNK